MNAVDDLITFWNSRSVLDADKSGFDVLDRLWPSDRKAYLGDGLDREDWDLHRELKPVPYLGIFGMRCPVNA